MRFGRIKGSLWGDGGCNVLLQCIVALDIALAVAYYRNKNDVAKGRLDG